MSFSRIQRFAMILDYAALWRIEILIQEPSNGVGKNLGCGIAAQPSFNLESPAAPEVGTLTPFRRKALSGCSTVAVNGPSESAKLILYYSFFACKHGLLAVQ
jgi:hypothetical protein